jgi:hypothetical protein
MPYSVKVLARLSSGRQRKHSHDALDLCYTKRHADTLMFLGRAPTTA